MWVPILHNTNPWVIMIPQNHHTKRWYLFAEMDDFSAQALVAYHPPYRERTFVVITQNANSHKSAVRARSLPACELGVEKGQPIPEVRRKFPEVEVMVRNRDSEKVAVEDLKLIAERYTPVFAVQGEGRLYLDLSGFDLCPGEVARTLKEEMAYKIGLLRCGIGVSRWKGLARMLAKFAAPDGIRVCREGEEEATLAAMGTEFLPPISEACEEKIKKYGIREMGQLRSLGKEGLVCRFGKEGEILYSQALGFDGDYLLAGGDESVKVETILDWDVNNIKMLEEYIVLTCDKVGYELKIRDQHAKRLTFQLKYSDHRTAQKSVLLTHSSSDYQIFAPLVLKAFFEMYQRRVAIQSFTLWIKKPHADTRQLSLFASEEYQKQQDIGFAVADIRKKLGFGSVLNASYFRVTHAKRMAAHRAAS